MSPGGVLDSFASVQVYLDEAAALLNLEPTMHTFLRQPMHEVQFTIPVRMDNGRIELFRACRVRHNNARGPAKGGIRYHCQETIEPVRATAALMTWKTAVVNLPLGGAHGGVACDVRMLSRYELERLSRGYIRGLIPAIGSTRDIPGPDMYVNPQVIAWMMDEYEALVGYHEPGVVTGKPRAVGGSTGRQDAVARGAVSVIREAARMKRVCVRGETAAIQGYGAVGVHMHRLAHELLGLRVIAVTDSQGGVVNYGGLDPEALWVHKYETGSVAGFPGADSLTNHELLELDVMVLIPAAVRNVITQYNADRIKARLIAELADGSITPDGDAILMSKGTCLLPDVLCNAGGVTVSYFEMVQNAYQYNWPRSLIQQRLDTIMAESYRVVSELAEAKGVDSRTAAYMLAVERVAQAVRLRGWV